MNKEDIEIDPLTQIVSIEDVALRMNMKHNQLGIVVKNISLTANNSKVGIIVTILIKPKGKIIPNHLLFKIRRFYHRVNQNMKQLREGQVQACCRMTDYMEFMNIIILKKSWKGKYMLKKLEAQNIMIR